jgi:hypothetical protein
MLHVGFPIAARHKYSQYQNGLAFNGKDDRKPSQHASFANIRTNVGQ